jgi:hypothetical protein
MIVRVEEAVMAQSVTRALQAIRRYQPQPHEIDRAILAAINVTLCLASRGDARVADGFNHDVAISGRGFPRAHVTSHRVLRAL